MQTIETNVAIVGAGPAGLCAVTACGHLGLRCVVIDTLSEAGGQCTALYPEKPIYDVPGFPEIAASQLIERLEQQALPFKPRFLFNNQVTAIRRIGEKLVLNAGVGSEVHASAVIIAAGAGAFGPNRPPLDGIDAFEGRQVHYWVRQQSQFHGKRIVVAGGGDSAVDWALALSENAQQVTLVHRRARFKAAPASLTRLNERVAQGRIQLKVPYQLSLLRSCNYILNGIDITDLDGHRETVAADHLLAFFGIAADLGPLRNLGLALQEELIAVDPASMATNLSGVFAIGDIAGYPHKQKLIVTGFAEAFTAARMAYSHVYPSRTFYFTHSTDRGNPASTLEEVS